MRFLEGVLDCLFPAECAACGVLGTAPFCRVCEEAVLPAPPFKVEGVAHAMALYEYGGPVALAIQALKFSGRAELGRALGLRMRAALVDRPAPDLIVPVPSSPSRLRERGYNPARELARGLPYPVRLGGLRRIKDPPPQVSLSREDRLRVPRGTFLARPSRISGKSVLVVEDVVTTGGTLAAVAEALNKAGAREIRAIALARTL